MKAKQLLIIIFLTTLSSTVYNAHGQAPTKPYGTNDSYSYGFMQTFETNAAADSRATTWYNQWKANYVVDCGAGGRSIIRNSTSGSTGFSEGQGYGMLLAAYAGDKALFDELWAGYISRKNANGLMDWITDCSQMNSGSPLTGNENGATDGDLDAAMALLIAEYQWPTATTPYNYGAEATTLINAIRNFETATDCGGRFVLRPGDAFDWNGRCNCINISYFAPGYYRAFARHIPADAAFWNKLADDSYLILNDNKNANTHLVSAWTRANGSIPSNAGGAPDYCNYAATGGAGPDAYQYDACRTPWRIATDYLWWGTPAADTWLTQVTNWAQASGPVGGGANGGGGPGNIFTNYNRATGAAANTDRNSAFVGAFALGTMANTQSLTNSWYQSWVTRSTVSGYAGSDRLDDAPYFQNSLGTMYMFLASGNFWNPYNAQCRQPSLGADISTCSASFPFVLNSNTPTATNVTFTWKRHTPSPATLVSASASANTFTVTSAMGIGTYVVVRDSSGGCTRSDTIVISNTIPTPNLGADRNLCSPAFYNLLPSNLASMPGGTTWQWSVDYSGGTTYNNLTGETASTLANVRRAGNYRLTATSGSCNSSDNVIITSSLPTPVDGCIGSGPGTVPLSITNAVGTNYNWYTTIGGSTIIPGGTGTTSVTSPSISTTTTYYVQDMSAVGGNVGPATNLGGGTNWGAANTGNRTLFSAPSNFVLRALKVPFTFYGAGSGSITIEIRDASNTVRATFVSDAATHPSSGVALQRFTFNGGAGVTIDVGTWGTNLKMNLNGDGTINGDPLWSNNIAVAYNYNSTPTAGVVTITGYEGGDGGGNDYMYFYDWEIQTGTPCDRLPVVARVGGCLAAPVELAAFSATAQQGRTLLAWTTASELNNSHFYIERSTDGIEYTRIGEVDGMGTKSSATDYLFVDERTTIGIVYYRLVQYDYDGTFTYSYVVTVVNQTTISLTVAPNPFSGATEILVRGAEVEKILLTVSDLAGRTLEEYQGQTNEKISIGSKLSSGVYICQVQVGSEVRTARLVKE